MRDGLVLRLPGDSVNAVETETGWWECFSLSRQLRGVRRQWYHRYALLRPRLKLLVSSFFRWCSNIMGLEKDLTVAGEVYFGQFMHFYIFWQRQSRRDTTLRRKNQLHSEEQECSRICSSLGLVAKYLIRPFTSPGRDTEFRARLH